MSCGELTTLQQQKREEDVFGKGREKKREEVIHDETQFSGHKWDSQHAGRLIYLVSAHHHQQAILLFFFLEHKKALCSQTARKKGSHTHKKAEKIIIMASTWHTVRHTRGGALPCYTQPSGGKVKPFLLFLMLFLSFLPTFFLPSSKKKQKRVGWQQRIFFTTMPALLFSRAVFPSETKRNGSNNNNKRIVLAQFFSLFSILFMLCVVVSRGTCLVSGLCALLIQQVKSHKILCQGEKNIYRSKRAEAKRESICSFSHAGLLLKQKKNTNDHHRTIHKNKSCV